MTVFTATVEAAIESLLASRSHFGESMVIKFLLHPLIDVIVQRPFTYLFSTKTKLRCLPKKSKLDRLLFTTVILS